MSAETDVETVVFQSGNSMAVRLPGACKLPKGTRVRLHRAGEKIVLEPITAEWPQAFVDAAGSWPEDVAFHRPLNVEVPRDAFAWVDRPAKAQRSRRKRS